ncbi:MAG: hypothetical protein AAGE01_25565 [Pseudomonadota bacterium]
MNAELPGYQRISHFGITRSAWTPESGLVTPTLKIVRSSVERNYFDRVAAAAEPVVELDR